MVRAGDRSPRSREELADRFAAAGHRLYLVGGSVRDALLGRAGDRPGLHHRRAARRRARARRRLGRAPSGTPASRSARSALRRRGVTVEITTFRADAYDRVIPQPRRRLRRHHRGRPRAAGLHRQRDGRGAHRRPSARSSTRTAGSPRSPRGVLDTPGHAGGVVRRRPAADAARRPVRRPARVHARPRGCVAAMTAMAGRAGPDHRRAGAGRAVQADHAARTRGAGIELLVDTGLAEVVLPEVPGHAAGDRRAHAAQGRLHALAGGAGAGDRPRDRRAGPGAAAGRAAARHRQARHPPQASRTGG